MAIMKKSEGHTYNKDHKYEEDADKALVPQTSPPKAAFMFPRVLSCDGSTPTALESR